MKLIGKQIVVELPGEKHNISQGYMEHNYIWNQALSEVAKMNQAWEVDESEMAYIILTEFNKWKKIKDKEREGLHWHIAQALASDPSAWLKRKE